METHKHVGRFTIFDILPMLLALAVGAFAADSIASRYGTLLSIVGFVVVSVLSWLVLWYFFAVVGAVIRWVRRFRLRNK